ncbi:MAG: glycosyl hydrolase [Candidatus Cryptobacteroides sp.]
MISLIKYATLFSLLTTSCSGQKDIVKEFRNPPAEYRPHARMWVPQAAIDETELRLQVKDLADAGFGDVEIVAFGVGRGRSGEGPSIDEHKYGWGTDKWSETMEIVLDEAAQNGIKATFTIGPAWPIATPLLQEKSEGVELQLGCDRVEVRNSFSGTIPEDCFAVVAGKKKTIEATSPIILSSLKDITTSVSESNQIDWTAPDDSGCWTLFFYKNERVGEKKNGFYVVDHFSLAGTQAVIDYYKGVFDALNSKGLLKYLSGLFGDSLEYMASVDWTIGFTDVFKKLKGYDLTPYLPAIHNGVSIGGGGIFGGGFGKEALDGAGERILNDYYDVVTYLFIHNHLEPMQKFLEGYGMNLRYQTAYGKYMEQASTSMFVGIPEGELMMIRNAFDNIRAQSGAVHLIGRTEYNAELQAEMSKNHAQSWQNLLFFVQRAFSAGVNNITLHGYNYSGKFSGPGNIENHLPGVAWPGWEGFGRDGFSNSWGTEPLWEMAPIYTRFIARNGYILKQGKPRIDLAVFRESFWDNNFEGRDGDYWYRDGGLLQDMGYSYDFVSNVNLSLASAKVKNNRLAINGPAYKAIILDQSLNTRNEPVSEKKISYDAACRIFELAEAGLPVIYIGSLPTGNSFFGQDDKAEQIIAIMNKMTELPNVKCASDFSLVPEVLASMNILPDASYSHEKDKSKFINIHRADDGIDYYYIYNRGLNANSGNQFPWGWSKERELPYSSTSAVVSFRTSGVPYIMNAWDGCITKVIDYEENNGVISIPVELAGNESVIIAFDRTGKIHATRDSYNPDFSESRTIEIADWCLNIESWEPGTTPTGTTKRNFDFEIEELKPWNEIKGLENVSGTGTYTATFVLEEGEKAIINLGNVNYSYQLYVNGKEVIASQTNTRIDIGEYVQSGENQIIVKVRTTLNNRIKSLSEHSRRTSDPYGLLGIDGHVIICTYR